MTDFAEPYATRVVTLLLGIPDRDWRYIADLAAEMGLALGIRFRDETTRIDDAVDRLFAYSEGLDRRAARGARR